MQEHVIMFKDDTDYKEDLRQLIRVIGLRPYNAMNAVRNGRFQVALHESEIKLVKDLEFVDSVSTI